MKKRIITGALIAIVVFPLIIIGKIPFLVGVSLVSAYAMYEASKVRKVNFLVTLVLIGVTLFLVLFDYNNFLNYPFYALFPLLIFLYVVSISKEDFLLSDANYLLTMTFIISLFARGLIYLRNVNDNANLLLYLTLTTMSVDTFAYFIGSKFGKRKLNERVSPKKSIEGSIGGIVGGLIVGLTMAFFFPIFKEQDLNMFLGSIGVTSTFTYPNFWLVFALTLMLTILGQIGDLMFSLIKRTYNVKDFSHLLPGHGGLLDRVDSISINVIATSFLYFLYTVL